MQAGDVIIGLSGAMIAAKQGYPKNSVIYSAIVDEVMPGKDYFSNTWAHRLDCIYRYDQSSEQFVWIPTTKLHATSEEQDRDIGGDNAKVLICRDFRYFGKDAVEIPSWAPELRQKAKGMGRGRPMFTKESEEGQELERLHQYLWSKRTKYTPTALDVNGPRLSRGKVEGVEDEEMEENEEDEKAPGPSRSHKC